MSDDAVKVLLVEDNDDNRQLLGMLLIKAGFAVEMAANGAAGLSAYYAAIALGSPFRVLVLDLAMSPIDGVTVAKRIRRNEKERDGKALIIGYTAHSDLTKAVVSTADLNLFDLMLFKPFDGLKLGDLIKERLG